MKKLIAALFALTVSVSVMANTVEGQHAATVDSANCVQVGQNESMVGGIVGGAAGSVGGAIVGSFFGKTGKKLGALAGGVAGGAYGASGDKIYNCSLLTVLDNGEKVMVSKQTTSPIQQGTRVQVVKFTNGQWGTL